jgi:hypothetical protein
MSSTRGRNGVERYGGEKTNIEKPTMAMYYAER